MDEFNTNGYDNGYQVNNGYANPFGGAVSMPTDDETVEPVPTVDEPVVTEDDTPVTEPVDDTDTESSDDEVPARRRRRSSKRGRSVSGRRAGEDLTPAAVRRVLEYRERLGNVDQNIRELAASLIGVKDAQDDVQYIVAMLDSGKSAEATKMLKVLEDTIDMDDLTFGSQMGVKTHGERKALFELEEQIAPEAVGAVLNGGKFPTNNPMEEVLLIRKVQKEFPDFKQVISGINKFLE